MKTALYTKEYKLSLNAIGITFSKIPVLQSVQLSFYQKYIILLLQEGISAVGIQELSKKISNIINMNTKCVQDFVDYLWEDGLLAFDQISSTYLLASSLHFSINPDLNNAMFADLEVKEADCNDILYIESLSDFYLEEDFQNNEFKRKGGVEDASSQEILQDTKYAISAAVDLKRDKISNLLTRAFLNTNIHLQPNFTYSLNDESMRRVQFEFPVIITYRYSETNGEAISVLITPKGENPLPTSFLEQLSQKYSKDKNIPRFISLDESFYKKFPSQSSALFECEKKISETKDELIPLQETVEVCKRSLLKEKKNFEQSKKQKKDAVSEIEKNVKKTEGDIKVNESVISNLAVAENEMLIANLKKTIEELTGTKGKLLKQIEESEATISDMEKEFKTKEETMNNELSQKESEIKRISNKVDEYEQQKRQLKQEFAALVNTNQSKMHPTIKSVISKYPATENILFRYVSEISIQLDSAVSASESSAFDEVGNSIDKMREMYRKVMQAVFDSILSKNVQNLASYFNDPYNQIAVVDMFRKRHIPVETSRKLIQFHGLANAIGHSIENGPQKKNNKQRIDEFKHLSKEDRSNILLAIPSFFDSIEFTKKEINMIANRLCI